MMFERIKIDHVTFVYFFPQHVIFMDTYSTKVFVLNQAFPRRHGERQK
jgi:hypothetical protein